MDLNFRNFAIGSDINLPAVEKTGRIQLIDYKKNPIKILLDNGTQLFLSFDQFNRINGKRPEVGRFVKVVFQRHPSDGSSEPSKIQSLTCY